MIRNFFTNQSKRGQVVRAAIYLPIAVLTVIIVAAYFDKQRAEHRREFEAKWQQEQAEIKTEAQRRYLENQKSETGESPTELTGQGSPVDRGTPATADMTPAPPSTEIRESVELMTSGPLKGMTVEDAKAFANKHIADAKAAATKRHEWELRKKELNHRWSKNSKQLVALARARATGVDDELQTMRSVFKLMSDEHLEGLRQDLLRTKPAEEVNAFFADLASTSTKTPEQITRDAEDILKSREAYKAALQAVMLESEQIKREREELERIKPF